jgi:hypothetical protein
VNVVLILIVSLALWSLFKVAGAPLEANETMLVVGVVAVAVVGTRRLVTAWRARHEGEGEAKHD